MMNILKILVLLVLLSVGIPSLANSPFGPVSVETVYVHDSGMLVVKIANDADRKHTEQCDPGRERDLVLNQNSPYEKEMFAIALAAKMAGKKVFGWANGCHSFWSYKAPKLTVIAIAD